MSARAALQKQLDEIEAKRGPAAAQYRELLKSKPTQDPELRKACDAASALANESAALKAALEKLPAEPLKAVE